MTRLMALGAEEELVPQEGIRRALGVDSLELLPQPQAQTALVSDQAAAYYLPWRALDYSLA